MRKNIMIYLILILSILLSFLIQINIKDTEENYTPNIIATGDYCICSDWIKGTYTTTSRVCSVRNSCSECGCKTCSEYNSCSSCSCKTYYSCSACGCASCSAYNSCSSCTCSEYNACDLCTCKTPEKILSPCATGSNTCVGGDVTTSECETLGNSEYKSGSGGQNYYSSKIQNPNSKSTNLSGNGEVIVEYIGES